MEMERINVHCQCGEISTRDSPKDIPEDITGIGMSCCDNCTAERFEYIDDEHNLFEGDTNQGGY